MDWSQSLAMLQQQGPVYWAAVAAVAAGAALLVGAGWLQLRRRGFGRRPRRAQPTVRATADGYTAVPPLPAAVPAAAAAPATPPPAAPDPRLAELRTRLAAASARLEALQGRSGARGRSGLKTGPNRVEYVHRSGRA